MVVIHQRKGKSRMRTILIAIAVAGAVTVGVVQAQVPAKCAGCHDMDKKKVGPAFKDVAAKYKGKQGAEGELTTKLKEGKGHPKAQATEAELQAAVRQALGAK